MVYQAGERRTEDCHCHRIGTVWLPGVHRRRRRLPSTSAADTNKIIPSCWRGMSFERRSRPSYLLLLYPITDEVAVADGRR